MLGLLLGGLWAWMLWLWLGLHPALHADALWLSDLLQSLQRGLSLGSWDLPPAFSLFPDLGILWAVGPWAVDPMAAQRLYGLVMGLWLWMVLARLLKELLGYPKASARALAGAALLGLLLLTPLNSGLGDWLLPGHHGAAFVAALSLWAWGLRQERKASSLSSTLLWAVLVGLLLGSDSLFGLWAGLPLLLLSFRLRSEGRWRLLLGAVAAVGTAWLFRGAVHATGARFSVARLGFVLQQGWPVWQANLMPLKGLLLEALPLSLAALAGLGLWAWPLEGRHSGPRVLWLGCFLASAGTLALALLLGSLSGRYLYVPLLLPALLLPALLAERWPWSDKAALLVPLLAALLWMGDARKQPAPRPEAVRQAAWLDQALRQRGLQHGWADYWHARPLRLLSHQGVVAVPMATPAAGFVEPYFWIGDRFLFLQGDALNQPQFIVVNGLDEATLRQKRGKPAEVLEGEGLKVFIYPRKKELR